MKRAWLGVVVALGMVGCGGPDPDKRLMDFLSAIDSKNYVSAHALLKRMENNSSPKLCTPAWANVRVGDGYTDPAKELLRFAEAGASPNELVAVTRVAFESTTKVTEQDLASCDNAEVRIRSVAMPAKSMLRIWVERPGVTEAGINKATEAYVAFRWNEHVAVCDKFRSWSSGTFEKRSGSVDIERTMKTLNCDEAVDRTFQPPITQPKPDPVTQMP